MAVLVISLMLGLIPQPPETGAHTRTQGGNHRPEDHLRLGPKRGNTHHVFAEGHCIRRAGLSSVGHQDAPGELSRAWPGVQCDQHLHPSHVFGLLGGELLPGGCLASTPHHDHPSTHHYHPPDHHDHPSETTTTTLTNITSPPITVRPARPTRPAPTTTTTRPARLVRLVAPACSDYDHDHHSSAEAESVCPAFGAGLGRGEKPISVGGVCWSVPRV